MPPQSKNQDGRSGRSIAALITSVALLIALVATATGALTGRSTLHLDSTDAQITGVFISVEDPDAPGGGFVYVENRYGNRKDFDGEDAAIFCFAVVESGEYSFSADVMGPNNGANSFFVRLDYFDPWVWEFTKSREFGTVTVTDHNGEQVATYLEAGQHVLGFYLRESGARLAGVNIHGGVGTTDPQPCPGLGSDGSSIRQETTTTESAPATTEASVTSTTESTPTTTVAPTTSTSEASTTSTAAAATTSTTAATTTSTTNATPTTVGGQFDVVISPTDDVNGILQSHSEGTSFLLKAGTYRRLTLRPKSGQSITGENGTVLDGEGRTPHALGGETLANDLYLRNLTIINYTEFGIAWAGKGGGKQWLIDGCEIAYNYAGIQLKGTGVTVRDSHIHHNTTHGLLGGAGSGGVVLEGNEISFNHAQGRSGTARGGILLVNASNSVVRNNHIHNNYSFGLHFDGHQKNVRIENNVVEDNHDVGILYELGSSATIRNNVARRNGAKSSGRAGDGAGILIFGSSDVTVDGNRVEANANGIVGRQDDRTRSQGSELKNLRVSNNTVTMNSGFTGVYDAASGQPSLNANNVFEGNSYSTSGEHFRWGSEMMTLSEWQEIHPNDG